MCPTKGKSSVNSMDLCKIHQYKSMNSNFPSQVELRPHLYHPMITLHEMHSFNAQRRVWIH